MKIKTTVFNSIFRIAAVLMVLCIVPSGAFASENSPAFAPAENITDDNYADVQAGILDSLSEQISELQSFYSNVSEASDASELQEVLSSQMPENGGGHEGNMGPGGMNQGICGMPGLFCFAQVESVTDDNYTEVQAAIVDSLENMTYVLNSQLDNTTDENMTEMLNEQITELETLSSEVSEASGADELQDVVFTYIQTQAVDSLEMEIEHLEEMQSNSETTDDNMSENISSRITEFTALIDDINGAESLEDLMEAMSSSQGMPGMGIGGPMQHGGCDCPMPPSEAQDSSTDDSTK
ncbi:hypothetical protein MSSIT_0389 [Methanosarcina siciliae T4/M]|uniref:Uncharacterized protein n=1 Tax=Methanosarcina siciliae T4/M TaxID=1434120 RepID=A0A0E3P146_9EURY|nr:hypothetical protein [Methanosarcina siciliae]AKB27108.1 hypothetical protein MSSIT_0389 [Methanosarcina siciliae T4/M]